MVNTRVNRKPGPSSFNITSLLLRQTNGHDDPVNEPDPRERHDNAANAIDEKVAPQHLSCADGLVLDSSQGKRSEERRVGKEERTRGVQNPDTRQQDELRAANPQDGEDASPRDEPTG